LDFGDTKVFEAAVLPAVMVLSPRNKQNNFNIPFSSVYMTDNESNIDKIPSVENQIEALQYDGLVSSKQGNFRVKNGHFNI